MSELKERYPNPETVGLPGNRAVVELVHEILDAKPVTRSYSMDDNQVVSDSTTDVARSLFNSSFADMVLPEGASLAWPEHRRSGKFRINGYMIRQDAIDDAEVAVDYRNLLPAQLRATSSAYVHEDTKMFGPDYWRASLSLYLWNKENEWPGAQQLSINGDSRMLGRGGIFKVSRSIISPVPVSGGANKVEYDHHSAIRRGYFDQEELVALTGVFRQVFEASKQDNLEQAA